MDPQTEALLNHVPEAQRAALRAHMRQLQEDAAATAVANRDREAERQRKVAEQKKLREEQKIKDALDPLCKLGTTPKKKDVAAACAAVMQQISPTANDICSVVTQIQSGLGKGKGPANKVTCAQIDNLKYMAGLQPVRDNAEELESESDEPQPPPTWDTDENSDTEDDMDDDEEQEVVEQPTAQDAIEVCTAFNIIMGARKLRKAIRFNLIELLRSTYRNAIAAGSAFMMGGGKCQSRKSPMKLCEIILCSLLKIPTVLLTTGVQGRNDLARKLIEFAEGLPAASRPTILIGAHIGKKSVITRDQAVAAIANNGTCVVVNNTGAAMRKAKSLLREAKAVNPAMRWNLVLDEADDFYRTDADLPDAVERQMIDLQRALRELQTDHAAGTPTIQFDVTATLLSIYIRLIREGKADDIPFGDIFYIQPGDEYVGTEAIQPLKNAAGKPVFLSPNELKKDNYFLSEKVWAMYDAAMQNPRSMLLDCTTSAVTAAGNTTEKAEALLGRHRQAIAIVVTGGEIKWRCGWQRGWTHHNEKDRNFSKILDRIDHHHNNVPIFVFGYSQMSRGISYRSRNRVPSHLVLLLGKDMAICKLVQAAGRAAGESQAELQGNGFSHVTILTNPDDYDALKSYPTFLQELRTRMKNEDKPLGEAMCDQFPATFGAFLTAHRPVAPKKQHAQQKAEETLSFEAPKPGELIGEAWINEQLAAQERSHMGMMRSLIEVAWHGQVTSEEMAMPTYKFVEELETGAFKEHVASPAETTSGFTPEQLRVGQVQSTLFHLTQTRTTRGNLFEVVDAIDPERNRKVKHYWLNAEGYKWVKKQHEKAAAQAAASGSSHASTTPAAAGAGPSGAA